MRVFVAGATGAVGRQLLPMLLAAGHEVTGASRSPAGVERMRQVGVSAVEVDVFDAGGLRRAVSEAAPDVVIHQLTDLAQASGPANTRLRRVGTRHLVEAARAAGVRRLVVQSIAWAYAPGDGPADESQPLDVRARPPRDGLVDGIRALEEAAAEMDTAVVLRYGILYGPGTWYAPGGPIALALSGHPGPRFLATIEADDGVSSFVHVADAARAAVAALDWPGGPVNIVDDEPAPGREWLPVLAKALGVRAPAPTAGGERWQRGALNTLARSRGWRPERPTWRTGFADQGI